jgi:AraC-like DNA-binding protein
MKKADRQLLAAVSEVIVENLASDSLSPDSIADAVSISRMQLYRKLKELTGMTPTGFIRQLRLERAAHLLKSSNKTVQAQSAMPTTPAEASQQKAPVTGASPLSSNKSPNYMDAVALNNQK